MELEMSLVVYTHMAFWIIYCFDLIYFNFFSSYKRKHMLELGKTKEFGFIILNATCAIYLHI